MAEFHLSIVSPERNVVQTAVTSAILPGELGYFGVLTDHEPFVAALKPGLLEYADPKGVRHYVYIGGGFAKIDGKKATVVADEALKAQDLDVSREEAKLDEARKLLSGEGGIAMPQSEAVLAVDRAIQRVRVARLVR